VKSRFFEHLEKSFPHLLDKPVLVACSGGLDSVVLTHLLQEAGCTIGLAHCNFNLRGAESDGDEAFVYDLASELECPFYQASFDTEAIAVERGLSVQMAARALRYQWFDEIATDFGYPYIATAHHQDDDLETMLINLSRGTGIKGLCGIPPKNGRIQRPFLPFTRKDLSDYAAREGIKWRDDSSNLDTKYLRNAIRQQLIPTFVAAAPSARKGSARTREHLLAARALLDDYLTLVRLRVGSNVDDTFEIDLDKLEGFPNKHHLLYYLLEGYGFTAWDDIYELTKGQSGKQIFSNTHRLLKDRGVLIVSPIPSKSASATVVINDLEQITRVPGLSGKLVDQMGPSDENTAYLALDKLFFPLTIRGWQEGDYFSPFGMKGKKKLSKFFKDEKLSLLAKEKVKVLCSDGDIAWVMGYRTDERFRVDCNTTTILKLTFSKNNNLTN
jgi:tRNA(Ile)-lysidine synthase